MNAPETKDPKTILVVDDDDSICIFLKTILEKEGFQVEIAYNGEEALEIVRAKPVHLIVLDWMMPILSGFGVLQALQKDQTIAVPVVVITASVTDDETVHFINKQMNVYSFMTKPLDYKAFLVTVRKVLRMTLPLS